jgi:hypothetical protein
MSTSFEGRVQRIEKALFGEQVRPDSAYMDLAQRLTQLEGRALELTVRLDRLEGKAADQSNESR